MFEHMAARARQAAERRAAEEAARLGDLSVQTSSFGTPIPKIFGTMRVAGTVIWATDLKKERTKSGGGKGQPKTVSYSYSVCFAVALSARPIKAVRRIWADGKLLRGAAGDFKTETGFRLYPGDENQPVDPLIAAIEGSGKAPAHRGLAYAVFEHFQLGDYGNRIPSLTFEIIAEEEAFSIGRMAEELSGGEIRGGATPKLIGFAASGDGVRGAIEALSDVAPLSLADDGGALLLTAALEPPARIEGKRLAASNGEAGGRTEFSRLAAGLIPGEVSLTYHDPARDFQAGLQRATRGGPARSERKALPAAATAAQVKALAEERLARLWAARETAKIALPSRLCGIRPGRLVELVGRPGLWRVTRWTLNRMVAELELVRVPLARSGGVPGASTGRLLAEPDLQHGPTRLRLVELPSLGAEPASRPQLTAAAAGPEAGWRRAALSVSYDGGASWQSEGATAPAAIMGRTLSALGAAGAATFDRLNAVEIELLNEAMWLEGRDDPALVNGANLAMIGEELVQFGHVEPLGGRRFRLSQFLRGRRGTEWAAEGHQAGDLFLLIEREMLAVIEPPAGTIGGEVRLMAESIGDVEPALAAVRIECLAVQPSAPVHLKAVRTPAGDIAISWVRRSRTGWAWESGSDTPLGEELESYRISLTSAASEREERLSAPVYLYTAAQQALDGATLPLRIEVLQVGTHASSRAAALTIV